MPAARLVRIELTVSALGPAEAFYAGALGFVALGRSGAPDPTLLGAGHVEQSTLLRGGQTLVLQQFDVPGQRYPAGASAADMVFQHFALPTLDIAQALDQLLPFNPAPITQGPPPHLPQRSGGATAYKFRDPDGHPLELIQFPDRHGDGIDHSAVAVADAARSIAFYTAELGLRLAARQSNYGPEQDALDGLEGARVDVVALEPESKTPHVELLAYQHPRGRPAPPLAPHDIAATRLVFAVPGLAAPRLIHDPDGHALLLEPG